MNEPELQPETRKCLCCGRELSGRSDKIFCDDYCRNNYYYRINNEQKKLIRIVNSKLLHNRGILKSLNPYGGKTFSIKELEEKGFDFNYFTNIYKTKKGRVYYVVYDYAYSIDEVSSKVKLIVFYNQSSICSPS